MSTKYAVVTGAGSGVGRAGACMLTKSDWRSTSSSVAGWTPYSEICISSTKGS